MMTSDEMPDHDLAQVQAQAQAQAMIARSFKYRMYPTTQQERMLADWQYACWDGQRRCIQQRRYVNMLRLRHKLETEADLEQEERDRLQAQIAAHEAEIDMFMQHEQQRERFVLVRDAADARIAERMANGQTLALSWADQSRVLTILRGHYYPTVPSDTFLHIARRVDQAYKKAWENLKHHGVWNTPRWARHYSHVGLFFRGDRPTTALIAHEGRFAFWTLAAGKALGQIKVRMHRPMPPGTDIRTVMITHDASGWYISFSCRIPAPAPAPPADQDILAVNLNCRHAGNQQRMAVTSDERFYMTTDNQQATARRLGVYQKLVSNRKTRGSARAADPGSKRTQKRRARIAKLHGKVARQREHQQQYVAKRIVDTGNVIGVSDENYAKLKKARREEPYEHRERKIKRLTNRSMTGTSPGKVRELILEKAEVAGRQVIQIEAAYATQTCHACGYVNDPPISLSVVYWACPRCGTRHDRDVNNAVNLAAQVRERQRE